MLLQLYSYGSLCFVWDNGTECFKCSNSYQFRNVIWRKSYIYISITLNGCDFNKQGEIHHAVINKIICDNKFDGKTIIILLDEPDLQLHPEWQQKFISLLLDLLYAYFPKVKFQIILTTHSPILLSDIPRKNVILSIKIRMEQARFAQS